jgi:SSS family solute:Na+ symporter
MIFAFLPVFLGLSARMLFPGIAAENAASVLPTLLLHGLPVWLGSLALAAVFSAEVGACEAILFMLSTSLSKDLYKRVIRPDAAPAQILKVARIAALIGGTLGMLLAIFIVKGVIDALAVFYSIIGAALLVPVVGGLYVKRAGTTQAMTAIAAGMITYLGVRYGTAAKGWLNPNLWGLVASAAGFFVSLAFQRASRR